MGTMVMVWAKVAATMQFDATSTMQRDNRAPWLLSVNATFAVHICKFVKHRANETILIVYFYSTTSNTHTDTCQ